MSDHSKSFSLGFIGGGNMSTAIMKGILRNDAHPVSKIWVSGPHIEHLKHWSDAGANVTIHNSEIIKQCDVIFLGVKPNMLNAAVKDCLKEDVPNKNILFISMLAGIKLNTLREALKDFGDHLSLVRIMPNTPMTVGEGACLFTPSDNVNEDQVRIVEKLLKSCGLCEKVAEPLIDSLGSLTACGPAFMYIVIEALADGAVKMGVPRESALRMASQMMIGSGRMVLQSGKHPGLLKDEVCSPGGSTICGVTALETGKLRATLIQAVEASVLRTRELGQR